MRVCVNAIREQVCGMKVRLQKSFIGGMKGEREKRQSFILMVIDVMYNSSALQIKIPTTR